MAKQKKQRRKFDARKRYDPKVKAAFLKATRDARAAGKTWAESFRAARNAGYTGTLAGIEILLRKAKGGGAGRRGAAKRGPGRPASVKTKGKDVSGAVSKRLKPILAQAAKELRKLANQLDGAVR